MLGLAQVVEREQLQGRYLVLELAALLDRLDEAARRSGRRAEDAKLKNLKGSIDILGEPADKPDRVERILRLYSDPAA